MFRPGTRGSRFNNNSGSHKHVNCSICCLNGQVETLKAKVVDLQLRVDTSCPITTPALHQQVNLLGAENLSLKRLLKVERAKKVKLQNRERQRTDAEGGQPTSARRGPEDQGATQERQASAKGQAEPVAESQKKGFPRRRLPDASRLLESYSAHSSMSCWNSTIWRRTI
jgi:hypothetical protein